MPKPAPTSSKPEKKLLADLRIAYHAALFDKLIRLENGVPNMADKDNKASVGLAKFMVHALGVEVREGDVTRQAKGSSFATVSADFLRSAFARLHHVRPGNWTFSTSQGEGGIARFAQYSHITDIQAVMEKYPELRTSLGGDYLITPDIVVSRQPLSDTEINGTIPLLKPDDRCARRSPLRQGNTTGDPSILHASISAKWSIRSDRSQNSRTEALNLIRNRKGPTPRIVVVTFEPLPSRIASIAMGTGDVDCTYHAALDELLAAAASDERFSSHGELLEMLVNGQRLRDISDLPLDLAS